MSIAGVSRPPGFKARPIQVLLLYSLIIFLLVLGGLLKFVEDRRQEVVARLNQEAEAIAHSQALLLGDNLAQAEGILTQLELQLNVKRLLQDHAELSTRDLLRNYRNLFPYSIDLLLLDRSGQVMASSNSMLSSLDVAQYCPPFGRQRKFIGSGGVFFYKPEPVAQCPATAAIVYARPLKSDGETFWLLLSPDSFERVLNQNLSNLGAGASFRMVDAEKNSLQTFQDESDKAKLTGQVAAHGSKRVPENGVRYASVEMPVKGTDLKVYIDYPIDEALEQRWWQNAKFAILFGLIFLLAWGVFSWFVIRMVSRYQNSLEDSEQHFRTIANGGAALIWTSGADKLFNYFNETWLQFTGRSLEQELGRGWAQYVHPDDFERCLDIYVSHFDRRKPFSMEYQLRHASGGYRWLRNHGNPRYDRHGVFLGFIGFCYDITEQKHASEELEHYRDHLEELVEQRTRELAIATEVAQSASIAKGSFLANMSHEIRTPLGAISGMAVLIRREPLSDSQLDKIKKLESAVKHLSATINDILDFSKIEANQLVLEERPLVVQTLVDSIADMLQPTVEDKGLKLQLAVDPMPASLMGDATRLGQALLNYLSNAVKFTAAGTVTVRCLVEQESLDAALLRFEVQDTGLGIAPDKLSKLFAPFVQADSSTTRQYGGTGLGLAITKRLVTAMGGEVGAQSEVGRGSTFWFTARLKKGSAAAPEELNAVPVQADAQLKTRYAGRRVLLAEDDDFNREIGTILLEDVGLVVEVAQDGQAAVEMATKTAYDLILMDMQMPKLDGLQATRLIRSHANGIEVPIVAMTANAFAEDRMRCLEAGMSDFLTKPVDSAVLYQVLLRLLQNSTDAHAEQRQERPGE